MDRRGRRFSDHLPTLSVVESVSAASGLNRRGLEADEAIDQFAERYDAGGAVIAEPSSPVLASKSVRGFHRRERAASRDEAAPPTRRATTERKR